MSKFTTDTESIDKLLKSIESKLDPIAKNNVVIQTTRSDNLKNGHKQNINTLFRKLADERRQILIDTDIKEQVMIVRDTGTIGTIDMLKTLSEQGDKQKLNDTNVVNDEINANVVNVVKHRLSETQNYGLSEIFK
jgi:hypothetical protein